MDNITIGARIKYERERLGLNQVELGKMIDVSKQCVSGWETGRRTPDIIILSKLAKLFGISIVSLFDGKHEDLTIPVKEVQEAPNLTDRELLVISRLRTLPPEYFKAVELLLQIKGKK